MIEDLGLLIEKNQPASGNTSFTVKLPLIGEPVLRINFNIFGDLEIHRLPQNYSSSFTESKENGRCTKEGSYLNILRFMAVYLL
jgi:hypothetical protein